MCVLRRCFFGFLLVGVLGLAGPLAAQQGTLTGRVTNNTDGQPIDDAEIQILGSGQPTTTFSNPQGAYSVELPPGTYSLVVSFLGYQTKRFDRIDVVSGQTTAYDIRLNPAILALSEIVVTASRGLPEKLVDAPATVVLVGPTEIQERTVATPVEHIRTAPGVDIITHGIQATNVVVRGFNNIFSGSLHALTDYRLAGVPSLRVNLLHFIPSNNEDIDRMEVVLGPGSALYGPNTANGVVHILTRSPLDSASEGTTVTLGGGERSVFQGSFRTSYLVNKNLGVKLSGQYLQGDEWEYTDVGEAAARESAVNNPINCRAQLRIRGYDAGTADAACNRVGVRDFDIKRYGLEARADYRFADDGVAILTYGRTSASGIELTGLGAGQTEDWIYQFFQARMNKGRFFTQAYYNTSDAGNSFLLRDGVPLVDNSTLFVAQAQHGFSIFDDKQDFTYGIDIFRTRPDTKSTINGVYEDEDNMDEWGVYLQSKTALSPKFDLILAGRVDKHSMLPDQVFSPRAALVFKPTEAQSFRVTYNRAFSTPTSLNFFLDISAGLAPNESLAALGYTVRAFGTGPDGYSFQNADGSLKGMRSPFLPGQFLPVDPNVMWPLALSVLRAQGMIDDEMALLLGGLDPSGLGIMAVDASTGIRTPLETTIVPDVPGIRESYTETFEVGWQGVLANQLSVSADIYYTKKDDFVSPLLIQNPLLLLSGEDVGALLTAEVGPTLVAKYMAAGLTYPEAVAQAGATITALATGIGTIPTGVAATQDIASQEADLIVTYRNLGQVDYWGADLGLSWFIDDKFTLSGTYSHTSDDWFEIAQGEPISLNAPKDKGSLGLAYRDARTGFNGEARVRFTAEFPAESAGYVGTKCVTEHLGAYFGEECVAAATLVDVNLGYKIPNSSAEIQLAVTNLLDEKYRSFVGVPNIGRFSMLRVKYHLF
jgi:outer membrane receptor for ferrienterochelin and colicins